VCSGIEAATVAFGPLGREPVGFAEIDPACCALLKEKYPDVPNYGDFTTVPDIGPVDLICGGTPCQDFSVAGKRAGLDGARGNLTLEFINLVRRLRPRWILWENVPGVLSIDGGRAFGTFLRGLEECGYGWAYRILDAQHFGLAQRRKRVFVVGYFGAWQPAAAVLLEPEGMSGILRRAETRGKELPTA
jgi:DNA (cytosine-5)-methyltransferase 1